MGLDITGFGAVADLAGKVIDKIFPDKEQADKAKLELLKMQQDGEFKDEENRFNAIVTEAKSSDPWTSRARPSFLYVIYLMILLAIPMGILSAFQPEFAARISTGLRAWLAAIPDSLWALFGAGYLGYSTVRTIDKAKGSVNK